MSDERTEKKKPPYPPNNMLKQARLDRGLTHAELAGLIGLSDPKTVSRWERGMAFPSPIFRQSLCKIFQQDEEALGLSRKRLVDDVSSQKLDAQKLIIWLRLAQKRLLPTMTNS